MFDAAEGFLNIMGDSQGQICRPGVGQGCSDEHSYWVLRDDDTIVAFKLILIQQLLLILLDRRLVNSCGWI